VVAGLNMQFTIWSITQIAGDDVIGGALITGTPLVTGVVGSMEMVAPMQIMVEQGLETQHLWNVRIRPINLVIKENDQLEPTAPSSHSEFHKRFVVRGIRRSRLHPSDPRDFLDLSVVRWEKSRS